MVEGAFDAIMIQGMKVKVFELVDVENRRIY